MANNRRLLLLGIILAGGVLLFSSGMVVILLNKPSATVMTPTPMSVTEIKRVTVEDAKSALDAGTAVFVDVRASSSYEISHIPGALLIPLNELANHMDELNRSSWIITYCT